MASTPKHIITGFDINSAQIYDQKKYSTYIKGPVFHVIVARSTSPVINVRTNKVIGMYILELGQVIPLKRPDINPIREKGD